MSRVRIKSCEPLLLEEPDIQSGSYFIIKPKEIWLYVIDSQNVF
jgi:hypothetical protein